MTRMVLLSMLTALAIGQPVFHTYDSLEMRVAEAKRIFVGRIVRATEIYTPRQGGKFGGYDKDGKMRPDGDTNFKIVVEVDEVMRGDVPMTIEVMAYSMYGDKRFVQFAEGQTAFLWFDGKETSTNVRGSCLAPKMSLSTIQIGGRVEAQDMFTKDPPVAMMDCRILTDREEILSIVRERAKQPIRPVQSHALPFHEADPLASLRVPIGPELEAMAKQMIKHQSHAIRKNGIDALKHFKSPTNIALLKPFLRDPVKEKWGRDGGRVVNFYPLRWKAYWVLRKWGIAVQKPVLEEPIRG